MKRWAVSCHTLLKGEEVVTVTSQDARRLFFCPIDVNWKFPWHLTCAHSVIQDIQVHFLHQQVSMAGWRHFAKSAVCSQKPWVGCSHKLEESLRTHFTTQTIWHLVMLCQYVGAQDGCCYYFVISTFRRETSEISLPCARMSTNDRTVGKEQQICYRLTESRDGLDSRWASAAQLAARRSFKSHHQQSWCTTYKCMQYKYIGTHVIKEKAWSMKRGNMVLLRLNIFFSLVLDKRITPSPNCAFAGFRDKDVECKNEHVWKVKTRLNCVWQIWSEFELLSVSASVNSKAALWSVFTLFISSGDIRLLRAAQF